MANNHKTLGELFTNIANAIRSKTGGTGAIIADNFPTEIMNLNSSALTVTELVPDDPTDPSHIHPNTATVTAGSSTDASLYHNLNIAKGDLLLVGIEPYGSVIARVTSKGSNSGQKYDDYRYLSNVVYYNNGTTSVSIHGTHKFYKITD